MLDQNIEQPQGEMPKSNGMDANVGESVGEQNRPVEVPPIKAPENPASESQPVPGVSVPPQDNVVAPIASPVQNVPSNPVPQGQNAQNDSAIDASEEAGDIEIIEKPWVDKAEDIIKKDKGKPYYKEEDHEDLQADYLKERFGKEIKKEED